LHIKNAYKKTYTYACIIHKKKYLQELYKLYKYNVCFIYFSCKNENKRVFTKLCINYLLSRALYSIIYIICIILIYVDADRVILTFRICMQISGGINDRETLIMLMTQFYISAFFMFRGTLIGVLINTKIHSSH